MKKLSLYSALLLVLIITAACEHKELCYDHESHIPRTQYAIKLNFDCQWEYNLEDHIDWKQEWHDKYGIDYDQIRPTEPAAVRVHIYDDTHKAETSRILTKKSSTIHFNDEGIYNILFYNSDTEYIVFSGMESFSNAFASTRGATSRSGIMNQPDMLFGAYFDSLLIEKKPVPDTINVTLKPLVFTYLLRFEAKEGAELIESASGILTGMAAGVNLGTGHTSKEDGNLSYQCSMKGDYGTQALIKSFGIPNYPYPQYTTKGDGDEERKNDLMLEVKLTNGDVETYRFDVTEQLLKQPKGGVIVIEDLVIGEGSQVGSGAFDIGVSGWNNIIEVPLN